MPGEDNSAFDLAEWYVKGDSDPWGPFDVLGIRSLAAQGRVTASTLVSRDGDGVWMRLKDAVPDWECAPQPAPEPEPPDPPLYIFYARPWVSVIESYIGLGLAVLVCSLVARPRDWREMAILVAAAAVAPAFGMLLGDRERVEVTGKVVRFVSAGRTVSTLPIGDIDRDRPPTGVFGGITGTRTIRSSSGKRLSFNRRAYSDEDYAELMRLLRLEAD